MYNKSLVIEVNIFVKTQLTFIKDEKKYVV